MFEFLFSLGVAFVVCVTRLVGAIVLFFSGLNLIFVSVKEFVIAIIICKMKNRDGFFYQTECYVIILYTCVCIIDLNVDILWDGCIFLKIC